uniref:Uncharacterized protein n=1 Tax=Arion vulgaris TaxID=1028688 RepID=A0A0B6Z2X4_9EUPU
MDTYLVMQIKYISVKINMSDGPHTHYQMARSDNKYRIVQEKRSESYITGE